MSDLLRYYRLEDDLGVDFYRGVGEDEDMETLMFGVWHFSCLTRTELIMGSYDGSWTLEEIGSEEIDG